MTASDPTDTPAPPAPSAPSAPRRVLLLLWAVTATAYVLDLVSKIAVVAGLEGRAPVRLIGDWLVLRAQRNSGAAFGIGETTTIVFTLVATAVAVTVVRLSRRLVSTSWAIALGLLLGGALGNLTDRLFRAPGNLQGAVVDFIAVHDFSVMNLADWSLTCGCALAVLLSFRNTPLSAAPAPSGS
ncbi:signal peptidase II [Kitasatospora cineracea]|uniref:signal peptidase II n=1 Tax=Kitasatospora cineracea TaxID=88074 RepID=UPI003430F2E5